MVYLITDNNGFTKIGVANDADARLKELQTGNANKLTILRVFFLRRVNDYDIEKALHFRYKDCRACGEWFKDEGIKELIELSEGQIEQLIKAALKDYRKNYKYSDYIELTEIARPSEQQLKDKITRLEKYTQRLKHEVDNKRKKEKELLKRIKELEESKSCIVYAFPKRKGKI